MATRELTLRGLILGVLITTVFTAANVYLGLKVGLTFASSIPAAVISMAILSAVNRIAMTTGSATWWKCSKEPILAGLPPRTGFDCRWSAAIFKAPCRGLP